MLPPAALTDAAYPCWTSGTALERTRMPLQKWGLAIYLFVTSLKGVSSLRLHRELDITQKPCTHGGIHT